MRHSSQSPWRRAWRRFRANRLGYRLVGDALRDALDPRQQIAEEAP